MILIMVNTPPVHHADKNAKRLYRNLIKAVHRHSRVRRLDSILESLRLSLVGLFSMRCILSGVTIQSVFVTAEPVPIVIGSDQCYNEVL